MVSALSLAQRQMVEIARSLSHPDLKLVVMDEPTSALSSESSGKLHLYLKERVQPRGISVIYVTHKLDDVLSLADWLVVLRNGEVCWRGSPQEISREQLVEYLGGQSSEQDESRSQGGAHWVTSEPHLADQNDGAAATATASDTDPVLAVRDLHTGVLKGINIVARKAEIVGLAGLEGAGQRDLLKALFFRRRGGPRRGEVIVRGPTAYVAGDRMQEGIFELWDIHHNILIGALKVSSALRGPLIRWGGVDTIVEHWFRYLDIAATNSRVKIRALSGGNQQKVLIARALATEAQILLLDDPTRGVDVATKNAVYDILKEARAAGRTIILYSTEDGEFSHCDRVYVFSDGRISAGIERNQHLGSGNRAILLRTCRRHELRFLYRGESGPGS